MNETKRRIKEYKEQLPRVKERVVAMALLVVVALAMATTSTFAWLVLSRAPEVTGATTSLAANGNLEIALVGPEGDEPGESAVGDSNLDLIEKNITWGNLVNLSDPKYGLEHLVLRPAQLNTASLITSPLYGAEYGADGRIDILNSSFGYATWVEDPTVDGYFAITDKLGVRVISSVTQEFIGASQIKENLRKLAEETNLSAGAMYQKIADNKTYMQSLATMMGLYMTARMNPDHATLSNPDCQVADVQNLALMYVQFKEAFVEEAEAMANMLNYQIFLVNGTTTPTYTAEDIFDNSKLPVWTEAENKAEKGNLNKKVSDAAGNVKALQLQNLALFRKDYGIIVSDLEKLNDITSGEGAGNSLKWKDSGLNAIVNNLVNVGACTIGADNTPISSIGASNAMGYLSGTQEARITNGILYNFEYRTGAHLDVKNLGISAKVNRMGITIPATVKANIKTTAPNDTYLFQQDMAYSETLFTGTIEGGEMVANDTYGLAVDLWVRTNAEGSFLTLGGNVLTETVTVRATAKDPDGNEVELYSLEVVYELTDEETGETTKLTDTYELYKKGEVWYNANTHAVYPLAEGDTPRELFKEVEIVLGYEGENRVWDGSHGLSVNSTTQGSGSCYVFYADTPEDQAKSLTLLASMKIAFVSAEGKKVATAIMDTEHFYAKNGKVIVPMVLDPSDCIDLGEDINGNPCRAIMPLQKNEATRLTAILYLDGTKLDNSQVLSSASIQGQLNVQFESSVTLNHIDNEELRVQELKVSAKLDKTSFNYDESSAENPMTTNVEITVDGKNPKKMTAFFIRKINETQGSREESMTFKYDSVSNTWKADYTFTSPGNYILRGVRLDGIEYDLEIPHMVTIEGFTLTNLDWSETGSSVTFMTANPSVSTNLWLSFASDDVDKMPKTVHGRFIREEDGSVANVQFTYDERENRWKGTAVFAMSGEYALQYLVLDGEYQEIPNEMQKFVSAKVGMRVKIYTTSPQSFKYLKSEMEKNGTDRLHMQAKILDDSDNELRGLGDVKLIYHLRGSSVKRMETELTWNGKTLSYEGDFDAIRAGAGIFEFMSLQVGGNTITNALTAPEFKMISPEPPAFLNADGNVSYQFKEDGSAFFKVQMQYVGAAHVLAKISDGKYDYWVLGTVEKDLEDETEISYVNFIIPNGTAVPGKQDGNWTLKEINVWNYYDAASNLMEANIVIDEDTGLVSEVQPVGSSVPMTQSLEVKTKVVATVMVSFPTANGEKQGADFGKDASGNVTGAFMDSYTIAGLNVIIEDFEHKAIDGISAVTLKYVYNNDSVKYGGYSGVDNSQANFTIDLPGSGTTFAQTTQYTIQYAGSWTVTFSFNVGAVPYAYKGAMLPTNTPTFTVSSVTPTVKITEASYASASSQAASTFTDSSTTVYAHQYETTSTVCGQTFRYKAYHQPFVTLTLAGYGNATSATMTFATEPSGGTVLLYEAEEGSRSVSTYTWSGDGSCKRWVGYWNSQTGDDDRTKAGTLKTTALVLIYNGVEYTVNIPITIDNPN